MNKKNTHYIVIIFVLLVVNLGLFYSDGPRKNSSFDDSLFSVSDTSMVQNVVISYKGSEINLNRKENGWMVNDEYKMDQGFKNVLFSILNRVRIKRLVGESNESSGQVSITYKDNSNLNFEFFSDAIGTKSFFVKDGTTYQVEVPGYRDNVVNIFELTEDQWRDRVIFDGSWRTIQELSLSKEQLTIRFVDKFFEVDGLAAIDSSAVIEYLNQFQFLQANEMISPDRFPELDSLSKTEPLTSLSISDIKYPSKTVFKIFPAINNQRYHLVVKGDSEMMVMGSARVANILKEKGNFATK